jgi:hypothetical protein
VCEQDVGGRTYEDPSLYRQEGAVQRTGSMLTQTSVPTGQDPVKEKAGRLFSERQRGSNRANVVQ